jgi:multicomponent K+:H+ antiporter subunit D
MILKSTLAAQSAAWVWAVILGSSLMALVGCARAGSMLLWHATADRDPDAAPARPTQWLPMATLLACSLLLVIFSGPLHKFTDATAQQLLSRTDYILAVIGDTADPRPRRLRPEKTP